MRTARLPIAEHLARDAARADQHVALAINHVFGALLAAHEDGDWACALDAHVPRRKGFMGPPGAGE